MSVAARLPTTAPSIILFVSLWLVSCTVPNTAENPTQEPQAATPAATLQWTVSPTGSGTVILSPSGGTYSKGTLVNLKAVPASGFFFDHWEGASASTAPQIDLTASGDLTVVAVFGASPRLTLESSPIEGGMVTSPGQGFTTAGTVATVTETPNAGYLFDRWEVDGQKVSATTPNTLDLTMDTSHGVKAFFTRNEWTILLYIAGGNDLAPQALLALKQLESVDLRNSQITVLALVDRATGFDSAWSGTRLYQVQYDVAGTGGSSIELSSVELNLTAQVPANLDMGDPETLKNLIRTAKNRFPATHYGVVFWGHGTGWRSAGLSRSVQGTARMSDLVRPLQSGQGYRAIGVDDDNGNSLLYTTELGQGLSAITEGSPTQKFGFIGMDLCFGAMIEELTEVKAYGQYFVGSEGLVPTNGWRYDLALPAFRDLPDRNPLAGATTFFNAFKSTYKSVANSMISVVDLSQIDSLNTAWNSWSTSASTAMTTSSLRSATRATLFFDTTAFYTTPGDLNLDMGDITTKVSAVLPSVNSGAVTQALSNAVKLNFSTMSGTAPTSGISIHFVPLGSLGSYSLPFDDGYIQGKDSMNTPSFVQTSTWVPSVAGNNFLDVIWYKVY